MANRERPAAANRNAPAQVSAVVMELDNVLIDGRRIAFDCLKAVLSGKGMTLTPCAFSRYCADAPPDAYAGVLLKELGKPRLSKDSLIDEFRSHVKRTLTAGRMKSDPAVVKLLETCRSRKARLGFVSAFDEAIASALIKKAISVEGGISLLSTAGSGAQDGWPRLAGKMGLPPERCLAVVTSTKSCREAMAAGMRCVACPDRYTAFQDFGGADFVFDSINDEAVSRITAFLGPS